MEAVDAVFDQGCYFGPVDKNVVPSVAIAMPLFNEADGIRETILDLDRELSGAGIRAVYCIQNDVSTDDSLSELHELEAIIDGVLKVESNEKNLRHGPTTYRAYRRALATGARLICQLDSDGQFYPRDVLRLIQSGIGESGFGLVIGARHQRREAWYRHVVTAGLRAILLIRFRVSSSDPNSPVRIFDANVLAGLLDHISPQTPVPNIQLTIAAHLQKKQVKYVQVNHRARRGLVAHGTMWRSNGNGRLLVPKSLVKFSIAALVDVWRFTIRRTQ